MRKDVNKLIMFAGENMEVRLALLNGEIDEAVVAAKKNFPEFELSINGDDKNEIKEGLKIADPRTITNLASSINEIRTEKDSQK